MNFGRATNAGIAENTLEAAAKPPPGGQEIVRPRLRGEVLGIESAPGDLRRGK